MTMRITHAETLQTLTLAFGDSRKNIIESKIKKRPRSKTGEDYDWGLDTSSIIIRDTDSHPV